MSRALVGGRSRRAARAQAEWIRMRLCMGIQASQAATSSAREPSQVHTWHCFCSECGWMPCCAVTVNDRGVCVFNAMPAPLMQCVPRCPGHVFCTCAALNPVSPEIGTSCRRYSLQEAVLRVSSDCFGQRPLGTPQGSEHKQELQYATGPKTMTSEPTPPRRAAPDQGSA